MRRMQRVCGADWFLRAAAAVWLLAAASGAGAYRLPVSLDDLLGVEQFGREPVNPSAVFSPDGQSVAFVRESSISSHPTWGYNDNPVLVRQRVFVAGRDGRAAEVPATAQVRYSLAPGKPWAPDGGGVLLIAATPDGYGLAYYDPAARRVQPIAGRPARSSFAALDWTPDGRIVFAALPQTRLQRGSSRQMLEVAAGKWNEAWNGSGTQTTVRSANPLMAGTGLPAGELLLADPRRGGAEKFAEGDYAAVSVSRDGRHVAAVRLAETVSNALSVNGERTELQIFAVASDGIRLLHRYADLNVAALGGVAWSPSGRELLAVGRPVQTQESQVRLYRIDAASGARREIHAPGLSFASTGVQTPGFGLQIGWLGDRPVAVAGRETADARQAVQTAARVDHGEIRHTRFDVFALVGDRLENLTGFAVASVNHFVPLGGGDAVLTVADGALWKLAPEREPVRLTAADAPQVVGFGVDQRYPLLDPVAAYHRSGGGERISLDVAGGEGLGRAVFDLRSGRLAPVRVRGGIVATAPDQLTTVSESREGWMLSLLLNDTGMEQVLATLNGALKDRAVAPPRRFGYRHRGKELSGWFLAPADAEPDVPPPAVVFPYGGGVYGNVQPPRWTRTDFPFPVFSGQLMAAHGYVVIYPDMPLEAGAEADLADILAEQAVAAVDALAAERVLDPGRVGIMGQSFGGFSTAAILSKRSDRFRAGVAMAGVYDWIHAYGNPSLPEMLAGDTAASPVTFVEAGQIRLGRPFWQSPEAYLRNSPIFRVETLDAPLLLLHGDQDVGLTDMIGAERMYTALVRAGKSPALVRYWGEGHAAQSAEAMRDQWARITLWLDRYVKDATKSD